jgi:cytoskeletal protein RodZ
VHSVSIGETLAEARRQAGLTVPQLSHQTRIRETIIRGIEQDDYSGCGGDFYARGHIRAMARAIGADPVPLIQEYDENNRAPGGLDPAAEAWSNVRVSQPPDEPGQAGHTPSVFDPAPRPTRAAPPTQASPPPSAPSVFAPTHRPPSQPDPAYPAPSVFDAVDQVPRDPGEAGADADRLPHESDDVGPAPAAQPLRREPGPVPPPVSRAPRPPQAPPASRQRPPRPPARDRERGASWISSVFDLAAENPAEITEPNGVRPAITVAGTKPPPRRENRLAIFAVAVLVVVGLLAYLLANVFSSGSPGKPSAGATASRGTHPPTAGASTHPSATPSQTPTSTPPPAPAAVTLHPSSAEAFGPSGPGQGDNQQEAAQAIDRSPATGWASDWYSTSHFGGLQTGTGLLLNMGRTVTISSAVITLASTPGAGLQLRAGSSPSLAALKPVAHANDAGGVVRLRLRTAVSARYVLVWFTSLPPDSAGTYQAKVYNIALKGNR